MSRVLWRYTCSASRCEVKRLQRTLKFMCVEGPAEELRLLHPVRASGTEYEAARFQ
jgi:hypothetical protein